MIEIGYCPRCGAEISELYKISSRLSPVYLEEGHLVYCPHSDRDRSWAEYRCPECDTTLTNDSQTAEEIMKMSQLEARSFEVLRNRRPEDFIEEI